MTATNIDYDRYDHVRPLRWTGVALELLDQRVLPFKQEYRAFNGSGAVAGAIHDLVVRGAPAIGIAAAWGVVLAARDVQAASGTEALQQLEPALQRLNASRPTAVNLAWPWRGCGGYWRRQVVIGSRCWNGKQGQSKPKTSPPIAAWAVWVPH